MSNPISQKPHVHDPELRDPVGSNNMQKAAWNGHTVCIESKTVCQKIYDIACNIIKNICSCFSTNHTEFKPIGFGVGRERAVVVMDHNDISQFAIGSIALDNPGSLNPRQPDAAEPTAMQRRPGIVRERNLLRSSSAPAALNTPIASSNSSQSAFKKQKQELGTQCKQLLKTIKDLPETQQKAIKENQDLGDSIVEIIKGLRSAKRVEKCQKH